MADSPSESTPLPEPPATDGGSSTGFHADDTATQFVSKLSSQFSKDDLGTSFRLTQSGVFVDERARETLIERYEKWMRSEFPTGTILSREKLARRLFGEGRPSPVYIVEGSTSLAGFMLAPKVEWKPQFGLPLYNGKPLDATSTLHPKDPLLSSIPGVSLAAGPKGIEVTFSVKEKPLIISLAMLNTIAQAAPDVRKFGPDFDSHGFSLRSLVRVLAEHLPRSRVVRQNDPCFLPRSLRARGSELLCVQLYALLFLVDRDGRMLGCVSTDGRSQRARVLDELRSLGLGDRAPRVKDFYVDTKRRPFIGSLKNVTRSYKVELTALIDFLNLAGEIDGIPTPLPVRFDIVDLLRSFTAAFQKAETPRDRPHSHSKSGSEVRRIGTIEFSVSKNLSITGVSHIRGGSRKGEARSR